MFWLRNLNKANNTNVTVTMCLIDLRFHACHLTTCTKAHRKSKMLRIGLGTLNLITPMATCALKIDAAANDKGCGRVLLHWLTLQLRCFW